MMTNDVLFSSVCLTTHRYVLDALTLCDTPTLGPYGPGFLCVVFSEP